MLLKTSMVTLVSFVLMLSAGTSWPQTSGDEQEQSSPQPSETSSPGNNTPHKKLFPDDVAGLEELATRSYQDGQYLRFIQATIKLREKRPYEQQYLVNMVIASALLGRTTTAYNYMHVMQQQGLSYDFSATEDTLSIRNTEVYDYLNDLLIKAGEPVGEGRVAFTLPEASAQPETIAWDDSRGKFLVGTIGSGVILAVTPAGAVQELLRANDDKDALAINGIAVDEAHKRLWVTTAGVTRSSGVISPEPGRGTLLEFNLETLKLLHRYEVPFDGLTHVPGSVAVTPGGDVYLIDRAQQMVFRKLEGDKKLEVYLASTELTGFRELALSAAGDKLYLADAALGIAVLDLEKQTSTMLSGPETMNLGGISGLMYSEGSLFVLQNDIKPQRLVRLELDTSGMNVLNIVPLAVALRDFEAPASGTVQGGTVYYFAGSNVPGVNREPAPIVVLKTPVVLSEGIIPVEQRKFDADKLKRKPREQVDPTAKLDT